MIIDSDRSTTCCFTGHRIIPNNEIKPLQKVLRAAILERYNCGYRTFVGGGAIGFDSLAELTVIELRMEYPDIRLVLVAPCADQDSRWNFSQRAVYDRIKRSADEIITLHEAHVDGCMLERNRVMVEMSSSCIAFYNGHPGGTRFTIDRCRERKLYIVNLFEKLRAVN